MKQTLGRSIRLARLKTYKVQEDEQNRETEGRGVEIGALVGNVEDLAHTSCQR